ncbi:MAG TPA: hypothetical protein VI076_13965 [Actinopolymorphaceae bacterium]
MWHRYVQLCRSSACQPLFGTQLWTMYAGPMPLARMLSRSIRGSSGPPGVPPLPGLSSFQTSYRLTQTWSWKDALSQVGPDGGNQTCLW